MSNQKDNGNNFIVQGAILGVAAILVRVLGLLYQMPLTRIIGDMGNGYYSYAYNVYSMVLLISSFSIPIAVSKMVSSRMAKHQFRNAQRVFQASMIYVVVIAGICALLTFILAPKLLPASQAGAVPALRVLCPVIFLSGILGVMRGYFQGYSTMIPTSVSQVLEGILNAVVSVLAAYILVIPYAAGSVKRAKYGAVGSTIGTAAGVIIGLLFMLFVYIIYRPTVQRRVRRDRNHKVEDYGTLFKIIFLTVTPVLFSSAIYNICPIIDQTLFATILENKKVVGQDISVLQGIYSAKYLKLVSVPVSIASALSSAIIPAITLNVVNHNMKEANKKIDTALKFTMLIALPSTVGMMVLAKPILLLFGRTTTLVVAVHVLVWGAVNIIFNCISTVTNAVLQGLDNMRAPVIHGLIALAVHILVVVVFLQKGFGIYALLLGTMAFSLVIWILNAIAIAKITGYKKLFGSKSLNILLATCEMGIITFLVYQAFALFLGEGKEYIGLVVGLIVACVSYLLFLYMSYAFTDSDYELLPMGYRIQSLGLKLHLIETDEQPFEQENGEIYEEPEEPPKKKIKKKFIFRKQNENKEMLDDIDEVLESEDFKKLQHHHEEHSEQIAEEEDITELSGNTDKISLEDIQKLVNEQRMNEDENGMQAEKVEPLLNETTSSIPDVATEEEDDDFTGSINVGEILKRYRDMELEAEKQLQQAQQDIQMEKTEQKVSESMLESANQVAFEEKKEEASTGVDLTISSDEYKDIRIKDLLPSDDKKSVNNQDIELVSLDDYDKKDE